MYIGKEIECMIGKQNSLGETMLQQVQLRLISLQTKTCWERCMATIDKQVLVFPPMGLSLCIKRESLEGLTMHHQPDFIKDLEFSCMHNMYNYYGFHLEFFSWHLPMPKKEGLGTRL